MNRVHITQTTISPWWLSRPINFVIRHCSREKKGEASLRPLLGPWRSSLRRSRLGVDHYPPLLGPTARDADADIGQVGILHVGRLGRRVGPNVQRVLRA